VSDDWSRPTTARPDAMNLFYTRRDPPEVRGAPAAEDPVVTISGSAPLLLLTG